jgi:predicted Zn-dependent peptidase
LESPGSRCAQNARQIMVYGRPLTTTEIIAKVEGVNATGITRVAQRIFSGPTTLAALGDKKSLDGLGALRAPL